MTMLLKRILLRNFRNYESQEFFLGPALNVFQGSNAQGKTNILEALSILSTGRSFRTSQLKEAIQCGLSSFHLSLTYEKDAVSQTLSLSYSEKQKKILHNSTQLPQMSSLLGIIPSVFIIPEDVDMIADSPQHRRKILDLFICQLDKDYLFHLARYYRALKHRNALLKIAAPHQCQPWEQLMAESAAVLIPKRDYYIKNIASQASIYMLYLSEGQDSLKISYSSSLIPDDGEDLVRCHLRTLRSYKDRDLLMKATLKGPHRDDWLISINNLEVKVYGSEGQKRCAVAAMRLAQWDVIRQTQGVTPLLALDDITSHLDPKRAERVLELAAKKGQALITTPYSTSESYTPFEKRFHIQSGSVIKEAYAPDALDSIQDLGL